LIVPDFGASVNEHSASEQPIPRQSTRRQIDDSCAAVLLGFSRETIRRMSEELGIGSKVAGASSETIVFTYEELRQLCRSSIQAV
jgi:hypothetical protein